VRLAWVSLLLVASPAQAGPFTKLIMPGPVIEGHADLEETCEKCHESFDKSSQRRLCLGCHDKVAGDVEAKTGYHGRFPGVGSNECKHCHTDHKGRDHDIVRLDPETFDHGYTDMALDGRHRRVACTACHKAGALYREAPSRCVDCHGDKDPHKGTLGEKCGECHDAGGWRKTSFDHAATDFPLKGSHRDVACTQCHVKADYKQTPTACVACHQLNDVHAGRYGRRCDSCHGEDKWKKTTFNHDRDTKFRLSGRHADVRCDACHPRRLYEDKVGGQCYDCHKADDPHRERFGRRCQECHNVRGWKSKSFDHQRDAGLELHGRHAKLDCVACHWSGVEKRETARVCIDCHGGDDAHKGELGRRCDSCHGEDDWTTVRFDHGLARFPLIGLHAVVPCEECHLTAQFKQAPGECNDCHKAKDVHKGRFGAKCGDCHNPNGWRLWRFDHNTQTDFVLDGAHQGLSCHACHKESAGGNLEQSSECNACHSADDVHEGRFGPLCQRCHTTTRFGDVKF
jgi:hypothetical protein